MENLNKLYLHKVFQLRYECPHLPYHVPAGVKFDTWTYDGHTYAGSGDQEVELKDGTHAPNEWCYKLVLNSFGITVSEEKIQQLVGNILKKKEKKKKK